MASKVPAGANKPADHQTAKADVINEVKEFDWRGTTYNVDPSLIDDLEFFEALETNMFSTALKKMLGAEQYATFKGQVKESEGRVSLATTQKFLEEYMEYAQKGKS